MIFTARKGQQTGSQAAIAVGIITILIIFYILFLPPEDRAELLGTTPHTSPGNGPGPSPGNGETSFEPGEIIFSTSPGKFDYQSLDHYEYDLPAFSLFHTEDSEILAEGGSFYVRKGWFDSVTKDFTFDIDDLENTDDVDLSMTLKDYSGTLTVMLNGQEVYNYEPDTNNIGPVELEGLKSGENTLHFKVSGVGLRFWDTNQYYFENVRVTGKISDDSTSESETSFYISPDEGEDMEKATLKFNPDCTPGEVGILRVHINDRNVFKGIPDCGILNTHTLSPSMLYLGKNTINFETERGRYLIDQISIKTELEEPVQPTYYFDLDEEYFVDDPEDFERCGEIDGVCPDDCDEDVDRECCFDTYVDGYWCDIKTDFLDDRCVGQVQESSCSRCASGYEDESGDAPEVCEELCGDDDDNECPSGCGENLDKDCCFDRPGDQYWCDDLPISGVDYTCVDSVTYDSCKYCLTGYDGEDRDPDCEYDEEDAEEELRSGVHIEVEFKFTDKGERKEAKFFVNGYESGFDTREDTYTRRIDDFVEFGTNSLRIIPESDLDIREINIKLD